MQWWVDWRDGIATAARNLQGLLSQRVFPYRTLNLLRVVGLLQPCRTQHTSGHCSRIAAMAAGVAVAGKCTTVCRVFSLHCLVCLSPAFFLHFGCLSGLSDRVSTASLFGRSSARQTLRLPLALRMLNPASIRIHHALLHHVMCLFDTSMSSCLEFPSSFFRPSSRFSPLRLPFCLPPCLPLCLPL